MMKRDGRTRQGRRRTTGRGLAALLCACALSWWIEARPLAAEAGAASSPSSSAGNGEGESFNSEKASDLPRVGPGPGKKRHPRKPSRLTSDVSEEAADHRLLRVSTGEDKVVDIDFEPDNRDDAIQIGNPQVVAVSRIRVGDKVKQLLFKPLKAGDTTVSVRDAAGDLRLILSVKVNGSNLLRMAGEIRTLLRDVEGLDIRIVGSKIILEGEVLVPADYGRIITILNEKTYSDNVMNFTTLSPLGMQYLAKRIQADINAMGAQEVRARVVNGMIWLEGQVQDMSQANRAIRIADLYLPEVKPVQPIELGANSQTGVVKVSRKLIQSFLTVQPPEPKKADKLIRVTIHFVELDKDYEKVFGFKWAPGFSAPDSLQVGPNASGQTTSNGVSFSATISSLFPKLQSAQSAGYARILKTGTVVVRSGQPAKLTEQTQIPYQTLGPNQTVGSAASAVGLNIEVMPQVLGQSDDIMMELHLKQTDLVARGPANTAPIVADHYVETKIYVKSRESAAVGGVSSSDVGTEFNKDDPNPGQFTGSGGGGYLFNLMRSKNYHKKKSQFVIFVTPEIVENASEGTEDLKRNFRVKVK